MNYEPFYKTRDRYEIYILLAAHCTVDSHEIDALGRVHFLFENEEKCRNVLSLFLSKKLTVYAHDMINAMRDAQAIFNAR